MGLKAPEWMGKRAAEIFVQTAKQMGAVSSRQEASLEAYAVAKARWLDALDYLEKNGQTVVSRTDKGEIKSVHEAPQVKIAERAGGEVTRLALTLKL